MSREGQRAKDYDETPIMIGQNGASLPLLLISLTTWFLIGLAAEGLVFGGWRLVRATGRQRDHPTAAAI